MNKPTTEELLKALVPVSTSCWGARGEKIDMHIIHLNDERYRAIRAALLKLGELEKGQPKVSREFVKKLVDYIQDKYVGSYDDIDEYAELDIEITRLFTGAGIEVEE